MAEDSSDHRSGAASPSDHGGLAEWANDNRRTHLLDCLREFDEPVTLPDLADEIAIRECNEEITEIPGEVVKEIYLSLYHTEIPELADAGIVDYDQETDLVSGGPGEDLDRLLRSETDG